jgi:class 3 adenylate cyclase/CHASE2 domain-containing sensor protein
MPSLDPSVHRVPRALRLLADLRWAHYLLLATLMTLCAYGLQQQHWRWADALDNLMLDIGFRLRGAHAPAAVAESLPATRDIVMVELPHPVPKRILAQLVRHFRSARAVALDLMLLNPGDELLPDERPWYAEEIPTWDRETTELAAAIRQAGNVVVGTWADEAWVEAPGHPGGYSRAAIWQRPPGPLWESARYHAHLLVDVDAQDNVVRRVPLFADVRHGTEAPVRVPCLGLALTAAAAGVSPPQLTRILAALPPGGGELTLGGRRIAYDADRLLTLQYVGGRQCFEYGSNCVVYDRVLLLYAPEDFAGKLVILGGADVKSKDFYPTPFGMMAGMQIHANVVATLRGAHGAPVPLSTWGLLGLAWGCSLLLIIPLLRWPLWCSLLVAVGESVLVVILAAWMGAYAQAPLAVSIPLFAIILTYNAIALYEYSRVRLTLMRFVGPAMVKRALYCLTQVRLGEGQVEEASAMFCDLRGYSTLAERLPPETMTALLNDYTQTVVTTVQRYHGRPVDYAGDGVFVLFEAALAGRHFPHKAVEAAQAVRHSFAGWQARWRAQGIPELELGVAIHTGPMMIGMLGADYFLKMGAVGNAVNVAARLQSLSEACGYGVLLTQETVDAIEAEIPVDYCGTFPIMGHAQPVVVYGLRETRLPHHTGNERGSN